MNSCFSDGKEKVTDESERKVKEERELAKLNEENERKRFKLENQFAEKQRIDCFREAQDQDCNATVQSVAEKEDQVKQESATQEK